MMCLECTQARPISGRGAAAGDYKGFAVIGVMRWGGDQQEDDGVRGGKNGSGAVRLGLRNGGVRKCSKTDEAGSG